MKSDKYLGCECGSRVESLGSMSDNRKGFVKLFPGDVSKFLSTPHRESTTGQSKDTIRVQLSTNRVMYKSIGEK